MALTPVAIASMPASWCGDGSFFSTVGNSAAPLEGLASCLCLGRRIDMGAVGEGSAASSLDSACPWTSFDGLLFQRQ